MRAFAPGDQVFMFYGNRPNEELFLYSGFVQRFNAHDKVKVEFILPMVQAVGGLGGGAQALQGSGIPAVGDAEAAGRMVTREVVPDPLIKIRMLVLQNHGITPDATNFQYGPHGQTLDVAALERDDPDFAGREPGLAAAAAARAGVPPSHHRYWFHVGATGAPSPRLQLFLLVAAMGKDDIATLLKEAPRRSNAPRGPRGRTAPKNSVEASLEWARRRWTTEGSNGDGASGVVMSRREAAHVRRLQDQAAGVIDRSGKVDASGGGHDTGPAAYVGAQDSSAPNTGSMWDRHRGWIGRVLAQRCEAALARGYANERDVHLQGAWARIEALAARAGDCDGNAETTARAASGAEAGTPAWFATLPSVLTREDCQRVAGARFDAQAFAAAADVDGRVTKAQLMVAAMAQERPVAGTAPGTGLGPPAVGSGSAAGGTAMFELPKGGKGSSAGPRRSEGARRGASLATQLCAEEARILRNGFWWGKALGAASSPQGQH